MIPFNLNLHEAIGQTENLEILVPSVIKFKNHKQRYACTT